MMGGIGLGGQNHQRHARTVEPWWSLGGSLGSGFVGCRVLAAGKSVAGGTPAGGAVPRGLGRAKPVVIYPLMEIEEWWLRIRMKWTWWQGIVRVVLECRLMDSPPPSFVS